MGAFYLAALVFLWAGRRGNVSRKLAVVVSAVCLLAGSGALAAAVYPWGNSYGVTVNRLQDLPGSGKSVPENAETVTPLPGGAKSAAPLPDGPAQKPLASEPVALTRPAISASALAKFPPPL